MGWEVVFFCISLSLSLDLALAKKIVNIPPPSCFAHNKASKTACEFPIFFLLLLLKERVGGGLEKNYCGWTGERGELRTHFSLGVNSAQTHKLVPGKIIEFLFFFFFFFWNFIRESIISGWEKNPLDRRRPGIRVRRRQFFCLCGGGFFKGKKEKLAFSKYSKSLCVCVRERKFQEVKKFKLKSWDSKIFRASSSSSSSSSQKISLIFSPFLLFLFLVTCKWAYFVFPSSLPSQFPASFATFFQIWRSCVCVGTQPTTHSW